MAGKVLLYLLFDPATSRTLTMAFQYDTLNLSPYGLNLHKIHMLMLEFLSLRSTTELMLLANAEQPQLEQCASLPSRTKSHVIKLNSLRKSNSGDGQKSPVRLPTVSAHRALISLYCQCCLVALH